MRLFVFRTKSYVQGKFEKFFHYNTPTDVTITIFTGNKGRKPDKMFLSKEFFEGADIDIEVKTKVLFSGKNFREEGARATKVAVKEIVSKG